MDGAESANQQMFRHSVLTLLAKIVEGQNSLRQALNRLLDWLEEDDDSSSPATVSNTTDSEQPADLFTEAPTPESPPSVLDDSPVVLGSCSLDLVCPYCGWRYGIQAQVSAPFRQDTPAGST